MYEKGNESRNKFLLLIAGGFFGGIANGLLGAGGGIIMTFVLEKVLSEEEYSRRDIFASVIAATLPISILSAVIYGVRGDIEAERFSVFLMPAVLGGLAGAYLLSRVSVVWLKKVFAVLVIWSGIYMAVR